MSEQTSGVVVSEQTTLPEAEILRKLHCQFNVALRRAGMAMSACDGLECAICKALASGYIAGREAGAAGSAELLAALKALAEWRSPHPRKLDAALAWRQNDDIVNEMVQTAIAKAEGR